MYLPAGEAFAGTIGLSGSVSAVWWSPTFNSGARFFLDGLLAHIFDEQYTLNLPSLPLDSAQIVNTLLANGCVAGFSYSRMYQIPFLTTPGDGPQTIAGAYAANYEWTSGPFLAEELLYLREVSIVADHPEFPADPAAVVPWVLTLRLATGPMAEFDPEIGDANGVTAHCTVTIHFGTPCIVNAPNFMQVVIGPSGPLSNEGSGDFLVYDLGMQQAFSDFFAFVSPVNGVGSLSWNIGIAGTDQNPTFPVQGGTPATNQATATASINTALAMTYGEQALTAFGVCADYAEQIEACNPTAAEICCTGGWQCGKVNPLQPFRWTRRWTETGAIFDLDPNNPGQPGVAGWLAASTIDDIANMTAGTPDCGISSTTAPLAFGGSFAPDRLGQSRVLVMQGTTLPEGLGFWGNRVIVEPIDSDIARRWRVTIEAVVRWDRAGAGGGSLTTLGTMRIVAETPVLGSPPIGDQAPMDIVTAFFRWTNLPLSPVGGEGFALDTAVNPDDQDDLDVEAFATFLPDSLCLSTIQLYGASGPLVDTQRFGWLTDSTNIASPQTRRLIRIRMDSPILFGLLNVGVCPPPGVQQSRQAGGCVGCGDGGLR